MHLQVNRPAAVAAATVGASATVGAAVVAVGPQLAVGIAGATLVIGLLRSQGVALALYLLVPPFLKGLLQPFVPVDLTVVLGSICVAHVAYGIVFKPIHVRRSALVLWFALFAMITIGSFYAPDPTLAFSRVQNWIGLALVPLLLAFWVANDEREMERFVWTCLGVALFVTFMALLVFSPSQQLLIGFASTINVGRASLMVPFIVFFFVMKVGPIWMRGPLLLVLPLTVLVSFAAGARGPLLMFFVLVTMLVIWHVIRGGRINKGVVAGAAAGVLMVGIILAVTPLPSVSADRFDRLAAYFSGGDSTADGSVYLRLMAADMAVSMFENHPAFGMGTGAFSYFSGQVPVMVGMENPHNVLLELGSDWGVMGLLLFGVVVFAAIRRRPPGPVWTAVWVLFLFFLANDLLGSFFDNRPFWGIALLLLAAPVTALTQRRPATTAPDEAIEAVALSGAT